VAAEPVTSRWCLGASGRAAAAVILLGPVLFQETNTTTAEPANQNPADNGFKVTRRQWPDHS
jgi:hypothetical protein